ncbi:MAG: sensor domain-containing diguanylate cyclase [Candidatus Omnitrophica bacterium]|nr:sensor domain-containing diguanylate cyclase [Candidatus Omnitrophota bacterium]
MRYQQLKNIVEDINKTLDLNSVAEGLVSVAFSLIGNNKGVCALYLIDERTQRLVLYKSKKQDKDIVIKAKEGDIFDLWVLRHAQPLLIEDIKKDFRFDPERLKKEELRPFLSLISSCLLSDHKFIGILRLDNPIPQFYSQDDLRFLVKICELGAVALDNSELFEKTQELAIHDSLTSFFNKGYFIERLKEEMSRALRRETQLSVLMIDIDFFKKYNDKFGHIAGDIVLKKLSGIICEYLKDTRSIICRFGGEEFCVALINLDKKRALELAGGLCRRIAQEKLILRRQETNITVSIGVAAFPLDAADPVEVIQRADKALYAAKNRGRNQVCCA